MTTETIWRSLTEHRGWVNSPFGYVVQQNRVFLRLQEGDLCICVHESSRSTATIHLLGCIVRNGEIPLEICIYHQRGSYRFVCDSMNEKMIWISALHRHCDWKIGEFYHFSQLLGEGSFGKVYRAEHHKSGEPVAVKIIPRSVKLEGPELKILMTNDHLNVMNAKEVLKTPTDVYIVQPLMAGGDLEQLRNDFGLMAEEDVKEIIQQLLTGLDYLHSRGIVHKDLKPANILYDRAPGGVHVRLGDFGLSKIINPGECIPGTQTLGTTAYFAAPEHVSGQDYDFKIDIWACGVIMYVLLTGSYPYQAYHTEDVIEKIKKGEINYENPYIHKLSDNAKSFLMSTLEVDPSKRISVADAFAHPWILK